MIFVTLLAQKGGGRKGFSYLKELRELKPPHGIAIHDVYFTLGRYDAIIVFDAPDLKTAIDFVSETGFASDYTVETLTAISAKEL